MAITKPFDEHIEEYENWFEINRFAYESELLAVKALLPQNGNGIAIGVGSGQFSEPLGIGLGIEPSVKMGGGGPKERNHRNRGCSRGSSL